jgi:hypothetical protein
MSEERRKAERFRVNLPARWETALAGERGMVSDISTSGCFMLTGGAQTTPGEPVRVALELPRGRIIELRGEVVYRTEEIGFAVRFTEDDAGRQQLFKFIELLLSKRRAAQPAGESRQPDPARTTRDET